MAQKAGFRRESADSLVRSISRKHSLRPFDITKESLCKILMRHAVKASFLDLLFGFRATDELSEKGYGLQSAHANPGGRYGRLSPRF